MAELKILKGDSLHLLKSYPDNYFDSVVTDAPYGLGNEPDAIKLLQDWIDHGYHEIKGKGFMGKKWDAFVPQPIFWKEVFRVLKPGGHLLCFFGTRTYDWGVLAIRLAGFEIRDMITWHYGSGFPKSMDVSKAIDDHLGEIREVTREATESYREGSAISYDSRGSNARERRDNPVSEEAKKYDGYGTALKPATEPICVARKPIVKNVANNVLTYGTGGLNIDACRIEFTDPKDKESATWGTGTNILGGNYVGSALKDGRKNIEANDEGRFPANLILDPFTAALMDEQTGVLTSGKPSGKRAGNNNNIYGQYAGGGDVSGYGDSGGASRFFYCAKASQEERNAGCENITAKKTDDGRKVVCDNAYQRGNNERNNSHPTVKPISLMRWLIRLVAPKGGRILDPFGGSGTTACAAAFEEVDIIIMELDEEGTYIPIIEARTAYWQKVANRERYIQSLKDSQTTLF